MGGMWGKKSTLTHRGKINITAACEPVRIPNPCTKSSLEAEVTLQDGRSDRNKSARFILSCGPPGLEQKFKGELRFFLSLSLALKFFF